MTGPGRAIIWSPAAEALFRLDCATAVSAGAGSGKTTALVEVCVRLFSGEATGAPCDPSQVVAITFTERAARELEERLRDAVAARVCATCEAGHPDARAWVERLHGLDRMVVGTIHGFARALLREHALEAGLDPEFEVLDEERASTWRREAARNAVVAALDAGRLAALALCAGHGAGGRRFGLADLIADIMRDRATFGFTALPEPAPDRVEQALAARAALVSAAEQLAATGAEGCDSGGLAALAERLAALTEAQRQGPLEAAAAAALVGLGALVRPWRPRKADGERPRELKAELVAAADAFAPLAAEALAGPQKRETCALVAEAEAVYAARKAAARALDFDDLLVRTRDLLRRDDGLRRELRARTRALLVDEYQDVNRLQQEIFDLFAGEDPVGGDAPPKALLVAVGDLKQSIYRFRGADVAVFAALVDRLSRARDPLTPSAAPLQPARSRGAGRVLHLARNHRSTPAVLALVNEVFERCMQPLEGAPRPYEIRFGEADRLVPVREGGIAPACELLEDGDGGNAAERRGREARAIATRIQALVSGAAGVSIHERGSDGAETARRPRYGDIAVLFRRLTQIGGYERALRAAGVPYRLARGGGFYQAPEVRDLGELLASLFDPEDTVAWAALLRSPFCGVSDGTLFLLARQKLAALARRDPDEVVAALAHQREELAREAANSTPTATPNPIPTPNPTAIEDEDERLRRFLAEWRALRDLRDRLSLPELLDRAASRLDLEAALIASPDGDRRAVNLRKAIAFARRFEEAGGNGREFAEQLRILTLRPPREPEAELETEDAVALLSVHQAKGLEWPVVFVPDLGARPRPDSRRALLDGEGRICIQRYDASSERLEVTYSIAAAREEGRRAAAAESRRLLYVALTRARDYLVLSGEAGNGESWRRLVEAAAAERPDLVRRVPAAEAARFHVSAPLRAEPLVPPCPSAPPRPPRLPLAPPVAAVRIAVTELAEYARCPRRHWFSRHLRLPEGAPDPGRSSHDDPARATARGTLAHAMLAELDLGAPPLERRAQLAASAARRGYDPRSRAVHHILADVIRFADSPAGARLARLARTGALRRELPFLLRLGGAGRTCYLVGAIDALAEERGEVSVIDFKYALARPGAAQRYRFQLLAYVLAASRALGRAHVRGTLQFLRGSCATVDVTPAPEELARFAADAPRLALEAARGGGDVAPEALGRNETGCRAEGCGYVGRCFRC